MVAVLGAAVAARAQEERALRPFAAAAEAGGTWSLDLPLSALAGDAPTIPLDSASASATLSVPLDASVALESARLDLGVVNAAVLEDNSLMRILLNGKTVGQLPLRRDPARIRASLDLDPGDFRDGYNQITFQVAQHYTQSCEDPGAPELWTEIDATRSTLALTWRRRPAEDRLSALDRLFFHGIGGLEALVVATASAEVGEAEAQAAALVVQAVAQSQAYTQPRLVLATLDPAAAPASGDAAPLAGLPPGLLDGADGVLVGTVDRLRPVIGASIADAVTGAFLGLYPAPGDASRAVLVVSGTDDAELIRAATALGSIGGALPDEPSVVIQRLESGSGLRAGTIPPIRPDRAYAFSDLGFRTATVRGGGAPPIALTVPMPADFHAPDAEIALDLDFGYSAGLRADSVLNVYVNGQLLRSLPLDAGDGTAFEGYRVPVPVSMLGVGQNRIVFDPVMIPGTGDACSIRPDGALAFSLRESSELVVPSAARFAVVPDLGAFGATGYPLVSADGGTDFTTYVEARNGRALVAAWSLLGRIAQVTGRLLTDVPIRFGTHEPDPARHALVVGTISDVGTLAAAPAPVELGEGQSLPFVGVPTLGGRPAESWLERSARPVHDLLVQAGWLPESGAPPVDVTRMVLVSGIGRNGILESFRNPRSDRRLVFLATAETPALLDDRIAELVHPAFWSQLRGQVFVWRDQPEGAAASAPGSPFALGELGARDRIRLYTSSHPAVFISGILVLLALLSAIIWFAVRRLRRRIRETPR